MLDGSGTADPRNSALTMCARQGFERPPLDMRSDRILQDLETDRLPDQRDRAVFAGGGVLARADIRLLLFHPNGEDTTA
jgi:hypothetical protein